ncbi:MAG: hypothetical protein U9R75_05110 [Candidatus Thermoplasmatota archaeon]|nr:hypothetical protein [Candidatus Thermoplasmatota archaeon]
MMIIVRPGEESLINNAKWTLVYGRIKTGKTFLCTKFKEHDEYFFVKRDRSIIELNSMTEMVYSTFREILIRSISSGRSVAVDEFHRLGPDFQDLLHSIEQKGRLTLISSTLHLSRELISPSSPLLGKFGEANIGMIDLQDILSELKSKIKSKKELVETAVILREPLMINFYDNGHLNFILPGIKLTVPALIGEIFTEEDRKLSALYEGIIRATAIGKWSSSQMSSYLFSRGLLKKDDPSYMQQYLVNLVKFGILAKVNVWNKKRVVYRHVSPVTRTYYYVDEKYCIADRDISQKESNRYIEDIFPHIVEDSIQEMFAKKYGLSLFVHHDPDNEVEGIFTRFKKPILALEVKWKNRISMEDIKRAEKSLGRIPAPRKVLFVPDKKGLQSEALEIMDISDMI